MIDSIISSIIVMIIHIDNIKIQYSEAAQAAARIARESGAADELEQPAEDPILGYDHICMYTYIYIYIYIYEFSINTLTLYYIILD